MDRIKYFIFCALLFFSNSINATDPVVIAEASLPETKLQKSDLVYIFTRQRMFWADGHKIKVFVKPSNSIENKLFAINVLNLSPYKYRSLLDSVIYAGLNTPADEVSSDEEMLLKISSTPYSIGYLNYHTVISNAYASEVMIIHHE